jgi:hypothetical protein
MLVKGPTGAPERKPFDTRHECSEREWFVVSSSCTHRIAACQAVPQCGLTPQPLLFVG